MPPKTVKCKWCNEPVEKEQAFLIERTTKTLLKNGSPRIERTYLHDECVDTYFDDKAFKEREQKQMDALVKTVLDIHGLRREDLSRNYFQMVQDIRNGTGIMRKEKRYKGGTEYRIIERAYHLAANDIGWAKLNKTFDSASGELRYGLAIVRDKLAIARQKDRAEKQSKTVAKAGLKKMSAPDAVNYKKKDKEDLDITDFLD